MAYTVTITAYTGGAAVDVTSLIVGSSFRIALKRGRILHTCNFTFRGTITPGLEAVVKVVDGATTVFQGPWRTRTRRSQRRSSLIYTDVAAVGFGAILDDSSLGILGAGIRSSETDRARIVGFITDAISQGQMTTGAISTATTFIASTVTMDAKNYGQQSIAQGIADICSETGAEWYVDDIRKVHYFVGNEGLTAPFGLSDSPNGTTTFAFDNFSWVDDSQEIKNEANTINATLGSEGANNPTSQTAYGKKTAAWISPDANTSAQMLAAVTAYVARLKDPVETISLTCYRAGIMPGMSVAITHSGFGLSASSRSVAEVDISAVSPLQLKYDVSFGDPRPDVAEIVQRMIAAAGPNMAPTR